MPRRQPYAVEREIDDLAALIADAGGSAHVWGLSSGAVLALRAAAAGLPITKLALYQPPFRVDAGGAAPADLEAQLQRFVDLDQRGAAVKYMMTRGMGAPARESARGTPCPGRSAGEEPRTDWWCLLFGCR
jgi:pimeloyl-ACP methyl ester carboxylesterase